MLFPTLDFALFFMAVALVLAALGDRFQTKKLFLTVASYGFYAFWNWHFCFLLAASSLNSYLAGLALGRTADVRARKWIVGASVALHLGLLGFFKYFVFFVTQGNAAAHALGLGQPLPFIEILLPVGISFFTFHGISYVVDVYRGDVAVCRRFTDILLYLSFFPQLVAGPIVRSSFFLPQLAAPAPGPIVLAPPLLLILGGLFKKVVLANYLATLLVDPVFAAPGDYKLLDLILGIYGYAVQIYCDFSAYTDIAIGLAALMGFRFPQNFDQPYRSASLREFWRRWHMTLSFWLRDYLYISLGGNRRGVWRTRANLFITMLLGGIWHGAAWTFVFWGMLHGAGLIAERIVTLPKRIAAAGWFRILGIIATFHFVCFGWLLFRSPDLAGVGIYLQAMAQAPFGIAQATPWVLALLVLGMALHFVPPRLPERIGGWIAARTTRLAGDFGVAAAFGLCAVMIDALGPDGVAPFIYFQF